MTHQLAPVSKDFTTEDLVGYWCLDENYYS